MSFQSTISLSLILCVLRSSAQTNPASDYGLDAQSSSVSTLARTREDNINCFVQADRLLADKWSVKLDPDPSIANRIRDQEEDAGQSRLASDRKVNLEGLGSCMRNLTKKLNDTAISDCMNDLVASELEYDEVISLPELFDDTLPPPFLTFLDFEDLVGLLKLDNNSFIFKVARDYLAAENSEGDRVFVIDQSCEWRNYDTLKKSKDRGVPAMLAEFRQQVIRSLSLQIAHGVFQAKDLRPGTWITVYRRWSIVRLENLKELETLINELKTQTFTVDQLCKYATVLATNFAEYELKILLPKRSSPLKLTAGQLDKRTELTEKRICGSGSEVKSCSEFRRLKKSFEDDLKCLETFGELLSNHILNSIIEKYADYEPRIRYPEIVCKKTTPLGSIAVRYCRCVGSFCSYRHVGHLNADSYRLYNGSLVLTGIL